MTTSFLSAGHRPRSGLSLLRSLLVMLLLALSACGGGVETGGTGAYVQGPVAGFGSVIVAGVRFDDSCDCIEDADAGKFTRDQLRLGMMVEIDSGPITDDGSGRAARARRVRVLSQLLGKVTALDLDNQHVFVLGQSVRLTPATVLDGMVGGAAALQLDDEVEVHGFVVSSSDGLGDGYVATRIERRAVVLRRYHVQGVARELQTSPPQLRIGTQTFDLAATGLPAGLTAGQFVRLTLSGTAPDGSGRWLVQHARAVMTRQAEDRDEAEIEGLITDFTDATRFSVNGVPVDAAAASFPDGQALGLGMRVEVHGRTRAGVLMAAAVEIESDDDVYNEGVDIRDLITSVDVSTQTFVLRGIRVFYGSVPPSDYDNGSAADLAPNRLVRVRATLSSDRTQIVATRIEFLD